MADGTTSSGDHERHGVGHIVPLRLMAAVLIALLILTAATVALSYVPLGALNIWIALGIATVKGSLVVLYFMHLRYSRPFNAVILISSLLFLALFIGLALMDTVAYQDELIWEQASFFQRK